MIGFAWLMYLHIHFPFKGNEDRLLESRNGGTNSVLCTEVLINNVASPRLHRAAETEG